jgi:rubrerythrin
MSWWRRLLDRLAGPSAGDRGADWEEEPAVRPRNGELQVFECQTCFKIFESGEPGALCPECDSPDVIALSR